MRGSGGGAPRKKLGSTSVNMLDIKGKLLTKSTDNCQYNVKVLDIKGGSIDKSVNKVSKCSILKGKVLTKSVSKLSKCQSGRY